MTTTAATEPSVEMERLESWAGEVRVNLIRLVAIVVFYGQHLLNVYWFNPQSMDTSFHVRVTLLTMSWAIVVAAIYFVHRKGLSHPAIKYLVTGWDVTMIFALVSLAGQPRGAFLMLFLLPIAAAVLRLSLSLVYVATGAASLGYLASLAHYIWIVVGSDAYYSDATLRVPRSEQIIVLLVFLTAGLLAGQAIRQTRRLVRGLVRSERTQS
jgi:hypothetical protein